MPHASAGFNCITPMPGTGLYGSVEFAVTQFGTKLVVVMGHTDCGAVRATVDGARGGKTVQSDNLRSIVDRIRPSVESVLSEVKPSNYDALVRAAVRANVQLSV